MWVGILSSFVYRQWIAPMEITDLFPFITGDLRAEFDQVSEPIEFSKGDQLYEQGFPCPFVPFIVSGMVRVFKIGESGREITLYRVRPGQVCVLSSTCSISDKEYPAIAEAEELSLVYVVPGADFRKMLRRYEALQEMIFDVMSERLMEMMSVVEEVAFRRVDLRLANRLLDETTPPRPPHVDTTHAQLAVELGSAREVVSRILKEFERRGFVHLMRGRVEVISRKELQSFRDRYQRRIDIEGVVIHPPQ